MKKLLILLAIGLMFGCASSHVVKKPVTSFTAAYDARYLIKKIEDRSRRIVPGHFLDAIKGYLKVELSKRNILAHKTASSYREIKILITHYRMRSGFNRMLFGPMAGKDEITSTVTISDSKTGAVIGESDVNTYNVLAIGGEQDIARMHAEEIAKFLSGNSK